MFKQKLLERLHIPLLVFFYGSISLLLIDLTLAQTIYLFISQLALAIILHCIGNKILNKLLNSHQYVWGTSKFEKCQPDTQKQIISSLYSYPAKGTDILLYFQAARTLLTVIILHFLLLKGITDKKYIILSYLLIEIIATVYWREAHKLYLHRRVTLLLERWHQKFNFSEVFLNIPFTPNASKYHQIKIFWTIGLLSLGAITGILIGGASGHDLLTPIKAALIVGLVLALGLHLHNTYARLSQKLLDKLAKLIQGIDIGDDKVPTALNSLPLLRNYDIALNSFIERLGGQEKVLSDWLSQEAEQSRVKTFGEISGLVLHDLKSPLQVIRFCTERVLEDPTLAEDERYKEQLEVNLKRSSDLIDAIHAFLRNPGNYRSIAHPFYRSYQYVLRLLESEFYQKGFSGINFVIDDSMKELEIPINQNHTVHIIYNLFRNSVQNLINNNAKNPTITTEICEISDTDLKLRISDNGTGLTARDFSELTKIKFLHVNKFDNKSLGLWLIKRLIEKNNGELAVENKWANGQTGTSFIWTIK